MSQDTLLEMVNGIALELRLPEVGSVISATDKNTKTILSSVIQAAERDVFRGNDWAVLIGELVFSFDGTEAVKVLPLDFDHVMNETDWDITGNRPAVGGLTPFQWQRLKYSQISTPNNRLFWMQRGQDMGVGIGLRKVLEFYPVPAASADPQFSCSYISKWYVIDGSTGAPKATFQSDNDTTAFDSQLVEQGGLVRMLRTLGMPFQSEQEEFEAMMKERSAKDQAMAKMDMTGNQKIAPAYPNTPGYTPVGYGRRWW